MEWQSTATDNGKHSLARTAAAILTGALLTVTTPSTSSDLGASVDACVQSAMAAYDIPGLSVAIVADGEIAYERGYGVKHLHQGGSVDEHTLFRHGSVGKMITGAAVMRLVDEGRIDLDDPVTEYVPELNFAMGPWTADQMRVRDLISNSAGIPSYRESPDGTLSQWAATLDEVVLLNKPGAFWNYSNSNFAMADLVVERSSGMAVNEYIDAELYRPAGMNDSTRYPSDAIASGNFSFGHADDGTIYAPDDYLELVEGFTSAHDLALWGRLMLTGCREVLSEASCEEVQAAKVPLHHYGGRPTSIGGGAYGYGIFVDEYPSATVRQHGGGIPGWVARLTWIRSERFAVAMLANSWPSASNGVYDAVECILSAELGVTMPEMGEPSDPASWADFQGTYDAVFEDGYRFEVEVVLDGDDLRMTAPDPQNSDQTMTRTLQNLHHSTFRFRVNSQNWWDVTFISNPGNPTPARWLRNSRFVGLSRGVRSGGRRALR